MNRRQLLRFGVLGTLAPRTLVAAKLPEGEMWGMTGPAVSVDSFTLKDIKEMVLLLEAHNVNAETYLLTPHPNSIWARLQRGETIE
jgi:hypothetical protein